MTDLPSTIKSSASKIDSNLAQDFNLTNTIRHPSNNTPRSERNKRPTQRHISLGKAKKRYSTDDIRLKHAIHRDSIHEVPPVGVGHINSVISATDKYHITHNSSNNPAIYLTPTPPFEQDINSDDNISYRNHNASDTDLTRNSKLTDLILKPRNAFRESDAYRHFSRMIRYKSSTRGGLTPSEASEISNERGSFIPSENNSDDEFSHLRHIHNRNLHHLVFQSQDMDKNLDAIKSDLERLKGDLREVKAGHGQVEKKTGDLEIKLTDFQARITNIERTLIDFTEMHHNEVQELKQQLQQVQYDSVARVQDLEEGQDALQRKLIELEVRSNMQESASQLFAPNGGGFFRSLLFKVLNVIVLLLSILAMTTVKVVSQFRERKIRSFLFLSVIICVACIAYGVVNNGFRIYELVTVLMARMVNYIYTL